MPEILIKLKNNRETVYFQSILGTYSHVAWVRTDDPDSGITKVIPTPDMVEVTKEILKKLRHEIEFEEVDPAV